MGCGSVKGPMAGQLVSGQKVTGLRGFLFMIHVLLCICMYIVYSADEMGESAFMTQGRRLLKHAVSQNPWLSPLRREPVTFPLSFGFRGSFEIQKAP